MYFSITLCKESFGTLRPQNHAYTAGRDTPNSAATSLTGMSARIQAKPSFTPIKWEGARLFVLTKATVYPRII